MVIGFFLQNTWTLFPSTSTTNPTSNSLNTSASWALLFTPINKMLVHSPVFFFYCSPIDQLSIVGITVYWLLHLGRLRQQICDTIHPFCLFPDLSLCLLACLSLLVCLLLGIFFLRPFFAFCPCLLVSSPCSYRRVVPHCINHTLFIIVGMLAVRIFLLRVCRVRYVY